MPAQNQNEAPVQFRPAWSVNGQFLAVASHEMWLTPGTGAERVPLPAETQGAQTVARGDFRFVEPMIRQFGPIGEAAAARARAGAAKAQKPGKATKGKMPATAVKPAIPAPTPEQMAEGWRRTGLGEARWWSASTVHPDGTVDATSELRDWQWRAALRAVAEQQRAKAAAKPARIR
jgi:hypothetical protein